MEVVFSRHAKRRMVLYGISEEEILWAIEHCRQNRTTEPGRNEWVTDDMTMKYGYPLKVVFEEQQEIITVITAYPLKRGQIRP